MVAVLLLLGVVLYQPEVSYQVVAGRCKSLFYLSVMSMMLALVKIDDGEVRRQRITL